MPHFWGKAEEEFWGDDENILEVLLDHRMAAENLFYLAER